jgi:hypothetical protein
VDLGLVDRLGGFPAALDAIREELEMAEGAPIDLVVYPPERTLLELLFERASSGGGAGVLASAPAVGVSALLRGMLSAVQEGPAASSGGAVHAPAWEVPGR